MSFSGDIVQRGGERDSHLVSGQEYLRIEQQRAKEIAKEAQTSADAQQSQAGFDKFHSSLAAMRAKQRENDALVLQTVARELQMRGQDAQLTDELKAASSFIKP